MNTVNTTNMTFSAPDWTEGVGAFLQTFHASLVRYAESTRRTNNVTSDQIEEFYTRGYRFLHLGDLSRALPLLGTAYCLKPKSTRYLYALALALEKAKSLDEALMAYLMLSLLQPTDPKAYFHIGECLLQKGVQTASEWFEQALEVCHPRKDLALIDQIRVQLQALQGTAQ